MKFGMWQIGQVLFDVDGGGGSVTEDTDLADVIAGSIAGLEGGDGDSTVEAPPAAEATPAPKPAAPDEEGELASLAAEWRSKNPTARGNIAIDRHQAVLTRTRNQHQ